jgi:uncharacterized protein (TIGR03435 family)
MRGRCPDCYGSGRCRECNGCPCHGAAQIVHPVRCCSTCAFCRRRIRPPGVPQFLTFATILALAFGVSAPTIRAQPAPPTKFEVASIRPCKADAGAPGGRSGGSPQDQSSPGRLNVNCQTVKSLIHMAYILFANGHVNLPPIPPLEGGPGWINSERYTIHAETETPVPESVMRGPMFEVLLEDRFQVKVHRETREVPTYALVVTKGGPKIPAFREGSCIPLYVLEALQQFPPPTFPDPPPGQRYCLDRGTMKGGLVTVEAEAYTLDEFTRVYFLGMDRPVVNRTGLTGKFSIHLEYAPDPAVDDAAGRSIFTALQEQLGLKLEPARGPREFLVIDRVERPSGN